MQRRKKGTKRRVSKIGIPISRRTVIIKITKAPGGSNIPETIKQKFVGLRVNADGPVLTQLSSKSPRRSSSQHLAYNVSAKNMLRALEKRSPSARDWFKERIGTLDTIRLRATSCTVI